MHTLVKLIGLVCSAVVATSADVGLAGGSDDFEAYKARFGKVYETSEEHAHRERIFARNMRLAQEENVQIGEEMFGPTKFSDLTPAEFKAKYLNYRRSNRTSFLRSAEAEVLVPSAPAKKDLDWRNTKGVVSAVKNQGDCGSCWAYSATEEIESMSVMAGHPAVKLSPQQIISCDKEDLGCNGGDTITAYAYVKKAGGMASEEEYPDTSFKKGKNGKCKRFKVAGGKITGHSFATPECAKGACNDQDEDTMAANMAEKGPVSICVNAGKWQNYVKGVMAGRHCGKHNANSLDHCVQAVGYSGYTKGEEGGYWLVRNSWETSWGQKGYIYLSMGENTCGIANEATFVKVAPPSSVALEA